MEERKSSQKTLTLEEIEKRAAERAEAVRKEVEALERSSRESVADLSFDSPGGSAWLINHPSN